MTGPPLQKNKPATGIAFMLASMFLFAGIMSSVTFGGSVPAILLNTPGTPPNAATCFDGYPLAQKGEGARAVSDPRLQGQSPKSRRHDGRHPRTLSNGG